MLAITSRWSISVRAELEGFPSKTVGPQPQSGSMLACILVVLDETMVLTRDCNVFLIQVGDGVKPLTIPVTANKQVPNAILIVNLLQVYHWLLFREFVFLLLACLLACQSSISMIHEIA